jgi:hypothetical protein
VGVVHVRVGRCAEGAEYADVIASHVTCAERPKNAVTSDTHRLCLRVGERSGTEVLSQGLGCLGPK